MLKKRRKKETKIATAAEYWGVKPIYMNISKTENGIKKKMEVSKTRDFLGKFSLLIGFKSYFLL